MFAKQSPMRFLRAIVIAAAVPFVASGCGEKEPLRVGFIGGLSSTNSDNGQAGLEAVRLAVEQFNRAGGVEGRIVELVVRDDAQNAETATAAAEELVAARVEAVIGPFTSAMAAAIVPVTGRAGIFQVSPTITSMSFHGKDDNLFRINRTTRDNARDYAAVMARRGLRRVAVAFDTRNRNFTESWLSEFRSAAEAAGSAVVVDVPYESDKSADYEVVVRRMVASGADSLLFISGALDVARLAQQARRLAPKLPIAASEWAATEQLVQLGGEVVDGLLIVQNYDRDDNSERYVDFREAYFKRFQRHPGYSSVSAYDAATVVLTALKNRTRGEALKASALRNNPYQGLQQIIRFDENGDTNRRVFFTEIRDGQYRRID